jgi:hypothetical protein
MPDLLNSVFQTLVKSKGFITYQHEKQCSVARSYVGTQRSFQGRCLFWSESNAGQDRRSASPPVDPPRSSRRDYRNRVDEDRGYFSADGQTTRRRPSDRQQNQPQQNRRGANLPRRRSFQDGLFPPARQQGVQMYQTPKNHDITPSPWARLHKTHQLEAIGT